MLWKIVGPLQISPSFFVRACPLYAHSLHSWGEAEGGNKCIQKGKPSQKREGEGGKWDYYFPQYIWALSFLQQKESVLIYLPSLFLIVIEENPLFKNCGIMGERGKN